MLGKQAGNITEQRARMLQALEQSGGFTLYQLIKALVIPLATRLDSADFLKLHSKLMSSEQFREFRQQRGE